jgi:hypothetical protein
MRSRNHTGIHGEGAQEGRHNFVSILLRDGTTVVVDDDQAPLVARWAWRARESGYVAHRLRRAGGGKRWEYLHRLVVGAEAGSLVDHINGDILDNRRSNLRITDAKGNARNQRRHLRNKSGFKGVDFTDDKKRAKAWRATISVDGHKRMLGRYATAEEAARAYDAAARKHFGEFARLNFPEATP